MKVVILAGGFGSRLAEETDIKPKPLIEIGEKPILWHIMKIYGHYGLSEFFIALGYKGESIKRFFLDYYNLSSNLTLDLATGSVQKHWRLEENWCINLIDTGLNTQTGGRLKRLEQFLQDATFMLTYGDGVSDVNLCELLKFHNSHGRIATVTAVRPPARFGGLVLDGDRAAGFTEKPQIGEGWINGGFLVLQPEIFRYIKNDQTNFEADVLPMLASDHQLMAYKHRGFWQCMDTLREKRLLDNLWQDGSPWKVWED
jgi:glucose-1-phosphate cytidylyltransferase